MYDISHSTAHELYLKVTSYFQNVEEKILVIPITLSFPTLSVSLDGGTWSHL